MHSLMMQINVRHDNANTFATLEFQNWAHNNNNNNIIIIIAVCCLQGRSSFRIQEHFSQAHPLICFLPILCKSLSLMD
jgi:hypothetical protein